MSKELWIEIEERLTKVFGRPPTAEEMQAEMGAMTDAIYEWLKDNG